MEFREHRIRRLDFTFHSAASGARAGSRSWRISSAIFDHARRDQQAQSHLVIESQRRHDGCAVEGATGVCYSIWLGAWRSLVAHLPWEQGVGRSNRLAPTRASSSGGKSNGLLSRGSGVRIPSGAPSVPETSAANGPTANIDNGECSSVGRASGCGPGGRGFKSLHSPQISCRFRPFPRWAVSSVGRAADS